MKQADRLHSDGIDPRDIQGSVNIVWLLHTLTEVFAFVNGLVSEDIYSEQVIFDIKLVNISNFILTTGPDRAWWQLFRCTQNELEKTWTYPTEQLQSEYLRCAMNSIVWFLERFGWVEPNIEQLERDQYKLIRREL
ncbi:MAG: hypothetical protein ED559_11320 [Phycisphaera sp.]|nr:MAG: hypothetical protein ED559_11320 [Phycisphaera sp.]